MVPRYDFKNKVKQLKRKVIAGFLINKSTYHYVSRVINNNIKYKAYKTSIRNIHMLRTEISFLEDKLVTGMLVKSREDYLFFKTYFEYNWLQIQGCYSSILNSKDNVSFQTDFFSPIEGLFYPFLYRLLGVLCMITCFGMFSQIWKYIVRRKLPKTTIGNNKDGKYVSARKENCEL